MFMNAQRPSKNASWRTWLTVGLASVLCLVAVFLSGRLLGVRAAPTSSALQQDVIEPTVQVSLDPAYSRIDVGDLITLTVRSGDLDQLYGFQWKLRFNPGVLQVVDADTATAGVQIISSDVFVGKTNLEVSNTADNTTGEIIYGQMLYLEAHGVDGEAVLGQVVFRAIAEGVSALRFGTGAGQSRIMCLRDSGGTQTPVEVPTSWLRGRINVGDYNLYLPRIGK